MSVILVTGSYDHKINFWEATSGNIVKVLTFGDSQINCLDVSYDKSLLLAGGNPNIQLFDIPSNEDKSIGIFEGHTSNITGIGFQSDQSWFYSSSEDGTIRIWDPKTRNSSRKYDNGAPVNTISLHPNQSELISGDQNGFVKIWDLKADKCREEYLPIVDVPIRSISISVDATHVAVGMHRGQVHLYAYKGQKDLELVQEFQAHDDYLLKCLISPDMKLIATTSADKSIKLWDFAEPGKLVKVLTKHQRWVWDCVFSADSQYLISASSDQSAKLWDIEKGEVVRNYVGHTLAVTCVVLNDFQSPA